MIDLTQTLIVCGYNRQTFKLMPVVFAFRQIRQICCWNRNVCTTITARYIPITNTLQTDDNALALPSTLFDLYGAPLTIMDQRPIPVIQNALFGICKGIDFKPSLDPKNRGNLTNHSFLRLLSHGNTPVLLDYSAAAPFSSLATRSLVWAPWLSQ